MGLPLLSHFLILSLVTMQAKVCEDASNNNRFSGGSCFLFTKHTNKMLSSKTENFIVYPMWGLVLSNSGAHDPKI